MLLTIALVVVGCAIMVLFSTEFANLFKKLFAIPAVKLCVPLILISSLVVSYEYWVTWGLWIAKWFLHNLAARLASLFPFTGNLGIANIIILMFFSVLPVWALNFWIERKTFESFQYRFITSLIIWLLIAILLTVSYSYPAL
jgi:hypothetical protein